MAESTSLGIILPLALALVAAGMALFWVVRPLTLPQAPPPPPEDDRLATLQARKEATLAAIRDLNFDFALGKLSQEDFARYDARLRRQALILLQQIDQVTPAASQQAGFGEARDEALGAEIALQRKYLAADENAERAA